MNGSVLALAPSRTRRRQRVGHDWRTRVGRVEMNEAQVGDVVDQSHNAVLSGESCDWLKLRGRIPTFFGGMGRT